MNSRASSRGSWAIQVVRDVNFDPQSLDIAALFTEQVAEEDDELWQIGRQYALVELADHVLAVDITATSQIFERPQITPVPNTPEFIQGVCNVRGDIFSIVDIRTLLGFPAIDQAAHPDPLVILLEGSTYPCGITIQAVSELLRIPDSQIVEQTAEIPFISGIFRRGQDSVLLLGVDDLLTSPEMTQYQ